MYGLYKHIPPEILAVHDNEYGLDPAPKPNVKVISLDFTYGGTEFSLIGSSLSDYDSARNLSEYFYRKASANTVSPFFSLYVSEEGLRKGDTYSVTSKDYRKFIRILNDNVKLSAELSGLLELFTNQPDSIFEELDKHLGGTKKTLYILTIRIDGAYIGNSPLFKLIRENASKEYYKDFYTLGNKKISGSNMVCSMCLKPKDEVWGYVSVYNFYTSKTEHASIAGGLEKELAHRNYPVCPDCAAMLNKLRPVIDKYFSFKFCGFDYFLMPEVIIDDTADDVMQLIMDIMVAQYDSQPGVLLDKKPRLGGFSLGKRRKIIDGYSKEVFDYLAETENTASYTMLFYAASNSEFKVLLTVEDVFPSQFSALYTAKDKAEAHAVFKNLPGSKKGELYDMEFRFDTLMEFLPVKDKDGDFSKSFLEYTRAIFLQKRVSYSFLMQMIMRVIRKKMFTKDKDYETTGESEPATVSVRKKMFTKDKDYELSALKAFLILKFMLYLGIIGNNKKELHIKEAAMTGKFADFFEEHKDFFDTSAKQCVFMTGVLTQFLINIQHTEKNSAPFRKRLNSMKLNKDLVYRIFTEAKEKLEQYSKNYYLKLEQSIAELMIKGGMEKLTNDEISFLFTLGMTLSKNFKQETTTEQEV
jgi:CRISPR-associated protein Csh1